MHEMRNLREHERLQLRGAGMDHVFDRQDGLHECARFRRIDTIVTAQQVEKRVGRDGISEFVKGPEIMAGKILPLIVGFAAHLWAGSGFVKIGAYESEDEAFDAITERFEFTNSRSHILRSA